MAKGTTQKYYDSHPEARKVKAKQQAKFNKRPGESERRVRQNKLALKMGNKGDGKDISHRRNGSVFLESQSKNRARNRGKA
tara:strand:- start:591 stop:833 length:243 start_codon:yes stop_codon:yes gene_type:complete